MLKAPSGALVPMDEDQPDDVRLIDVSTPKHPNTFARVSECDFDRLNKYKWTATKPKNVIYAIRPVVKNGKKTTARMHIEIMGQIDIDHIDGDGLNNCRSNLRKCTNSENQQNRKRGYGSSKYKGVSWHKHMRLWRATIVVSGKQKTLGYFKDEIHAAIAYDLAAPIYFGEFASTNGVLGNG